MVPTDNMEEQTPCNAGQRAVEYAALLMVSLSPIGNPHFPHHRPLSVDEEAGW